MSSLGGSGVSEIIVFNRNLLNDLKLRSVGYAPKVNKKKSDDELLRK